METLQKATRLTLKEYLTSTSLHGFKYFASEKLKDRLGWLVVVILSFLMASLLVTRSVSRFRQTPTFLTMRDVELQDDRFVAVSVSVCPPTPISDPAARQVLKNMKYFYSFEDGYISFAVPRFSAIITHEMRAYNRSLKTRVGKPWNGPIDGIYFNCSDIFVRCQMGIITKNCADLFQLTATATGFCCTYSPRKRAQMEKYHKRTLRQLRFITQMTPDMLESKILSDTNHKILIEEDNSFLGLHESAISLKLGFENFIEVTGTEYLFSSDILAMKYNLRGCLVPHDRPNTEWNEEYNHKNCYYKCGTAYLLAQCKCYSLANPFDTNFENICDDTHLGCLMRMRDIFNTEYFNNCHCPRTCSFNDTVIDIATFKLNALDSVSDPFYDNINKSTMSVIHVTNNHKGRSRVIFTKPLWKYIADLGGICSLFVGWSIPCLVELAYFFTLRLTLNYIKLRRAV